MTARSATDGVVMAPPLRKLETGFEPVTAAEFRAAISGLATAVSVLTTDGPAGRAGLTCSAVCSVSDSPPTILACVNRRSAAYATIIANGVFCANCLPACRRDLSQIFAGVGQVPMADRFDPNLWSALCTGAPCLKDALTVFDCELAEAREVATHGVLIGRVLATADNGSVEPLIHHRQRYATTRALP
jgi:flavin reductase (DIM6/NTAB) family NADH-FMN oxidoreductase RutF